MEGIKYINLAEIGSIVYGLQGVKIGYFVVRVNNTLVVSHA